MLTTPVEKMDAPNPSSPPMETDLLAILWHHATDEKFESKVVKNLTRQLLQEFTGAQ